MKQTLITLLFFFTGFTVLAQVGIGTLNPKAALDISSDKGLLISRMSDHTTLIPIDGTLDTNEKGLQVYNESTNTIMLWEGGQWESIYIGGNPVGTVIMSFAVSAPSGYLYADGSTFDALVYPELNTVLGGNTLPDLRGVFLRGLDDGRGLDSGRTLGSYQADEFKSHSHSLTHPKWFDGTPITGNSIRGSNTLINNAVVSSTSDSGVQKHVLRM